MKFENDVLNVINLGSRFSKRLNESNYLNDFSFSVKKNNAIAFYFNQQLTKKNFINIFLQKEKNHIGLFIENNNFINSLENNSFFLSPEIFKKLDPKKRSIEIIEQIVFQHNLAQINEITSQNENISSSIKLMKLLNLLRFKLFFNQHMIKNQKNSIQFLENQLFLLNDSIKRKAPILKIYNDFIQLHIRHLSNKINLIIESNYYMVDLYERKIEQKILANRASLREKALSLIKKINDLNIQHHSDLKRLKVELETFLKKELNLQNNIQEHKNDNKENNFIEIIDYLMDDLNEQAKIFKLHLDNDNNKKDKETKKIKAFSLILLEELSSFILKNKHNFFFETFEEAIDFYLKINNKITEIIYDSYDKLDELYNHKKIKEYVINIFNKDIKTISNTKEQTTESDDFISKSLEIINNDSHPSNQFSKIQMECESLIHDIDWEIKSSTFRIKEQIDEINLKNANALKEYSDLDNEYQKLLKEFLETKNKYLASDKSRGVKKQLDDSLFYQEASKMETIYDFVDKDNRMISKFFYSNKSNNQNSNNKIGLLLKRYTILKSCSLFDLSIFDLLKRIGKLDETSKKIFLLLAAYNVDKKIIIFESLFNNLKDENLLEIKQIYLKILKISNKYWILIEDNFLNLKSLVDNAYVVDNAKIIEYGTIEKLLKNPLYDITRKLFKLKLKENSLIYKSETVFENIINNDYYQISKEHYIFGNMDQIYEKTNIIPQSYWNTKKSEQLNIFTSKLEFDNLRKKTINKQNVDDESKSLINSEEFLIIDVK